jgi:tRNA threonylcarbamoyladenosine biosynthesis protein TsaE
LTEWQLPDLAASRALAHDLAARLPPQALLLLDGPLGAGKTTLTGLIAEALGSSAHVSSPTYTLVHEYPTPAGTLVHIDAYRLPSADALASLGLDEYLARARLVVVEWGAPLRAAYPEAWLLRLGLRGGHRSARLEAPPVADAERAAREERP